MRGFPLKLLWSILLYAGFVSAIHRSYLYPHGRGVPDKILPPQDDISSPELVLKVPIVFYDDTYHSVFINSNGLLSFITELSSFFNIQFPLDYPVIAPLYTNIDVRASGSIYYRETQELQILERGTDTVKKAFRSAKDFKARSVLIVTWEDVGYHNQGADKVNTFQVAVISGDNDTYVELLYPENGIQWIKGTGSSSSLPDALAQAGFVSSDGRMLLLKGSGTDQISHLNQWTNNGNPGQWVYHVGRVGPDGNANPPDFHTVEEGEIPKTCAAGMFYCHSKAICDDYGSGFCCACKPGYYGNGISCLNEDVPVRVNGKLTGTVNGINVSDVVLQAYVVPKDGRSYTALSKVPMNVGYDMQSLNVLGSTIGWLFAKPVKGASNGYQLTGGVFNQTVTITYPQTGHQLVLRQRFTGLDVFEQLTMTAEIKGDVPNIPIGSKITIKDYQEQYTHIGPGQLLAHSSQVFQLEGVQIDNTFTVEQNILYNECSHLAAPVPPFRLKVARNFIGYETEHIIRYAMNNKVTPLGVDEDPCKEGRNQCGRHSTCIAEGDTFRCICNPGYQYTIVSETEGACIDADECVTDTHNCNTNAVCINNQGSFYCQCSSGYSGDGVSCIRDQTCDDLRCDYNAYCVQRIKNSPVCFCKEGFEGNGTHCTPIVHSSRGSEYGPDFRQDHGTLDYNSDTRSYSGSNYNANEGVKNNSDHRPEEGLDYKPEEGRDYTLEERQNYRPDGGIQETPIYRPDHKPDSRSEYTPDESKHFKPDHWQNHGLQPGPEMKHETDVPARCVLNLCHCPEGYELEEARRRCFKRKDSKDERHDIDDIPCNVLDRCHPHAQCVATTAIGNYRCVCNRGFQGDGTECIPSINRFPYEEDECLTALDCVGEADCVYDGHLRRNTCVCFKGFFKDPISRICAEERMEDPKTASCKDFNDCHQDAVCEMQEPGRPECKCKVGYEGDGKHECRKTEVGCQTAFNCAEGTADCLFDATHDQFRCRCKPGYDGDGYTCTPMVTCLEDPSICGKNASCMPSHERGFSCRCNQGFIGNGVLCKPEPEKIGNFLLLNQGNTMMRLPFNPTSQDPAKPIMMQYVQQSIGIDVDCTENRVYWSDIAGKKIESATYMGTDVKKFISEDIASVEGLAVDWLSRNLYWTDSKKDTIEVANLENPTLRKVLITGNLVNPRGIAVHPSRGKLFWSDWNRAGPKIEWSNLDGSNRMVFAEGPSVQLPNSLAVDFETDEVCWADAGTKAIECTGIINRYTRTVTRNCSYPFGLAISRDYYYWTDWTTRKVERIFRRTQASEKPLSVPLVGSAKLYGIVAVPESCPRISNICQHDYGRCPENHLCLPDGGGGRNCVCGIKTCEKIN